MPKPDDFFDIRNSFHQLSEEYKSNWSNYLEPIKAFARTTYASLYVIDYDTRSFEYVSDNPLFLCGKTAEEVKEMGYEFYFEHVPEEDLQLLLKINSVGFDFYETLPTKDVNLYTLSYDFHLINEEGNLILINQKITPLFTDEQGKLWKAVCFVSLSSEKKAGNIRIFKKDDPTILEYDLEKNFWRESTKVTLNDREKEILLLSARGYTITEIANSIYVSPDTVKFHRKKMFQKLKVSSISEAIAFATNNKLI